MTQKSYLSHQALDLRKHAVLFRNPVTSFFFVVEGSISVSESTYEFASSETSELAISVSSHHGGESSQTNDYGSTEQSHDIGENEVRLRKAGRGSMMAASGFHSQTDDTWTNVTVKTTSAAANQLQYGLGIV